MHYRYFQKNKLFKKISFAIVIGVMLMNAVGCEKLINYEELAERILNEKYKDEFVIEEVVRSNIFDDYYIATAYQADNPDTLFRVFVDNDGSAASDNYVGKIVCNQLSDQVAKNLDSVSGTYYIYSSTIVDSLEQMDPTITLDEYISSHPEMKYGIYLFYCPDEFDKEDIYHGLSEMFHGLSISGNVYLHIMDESMMQKIQNYLETHDKIYDEGKQLMKPYSCGIIEFSDGMINSSRDEIFHMLEEK